MALAFTLCEHHTRIAFPCREQEGGFNTKLGAHLLSAWRGSMPRPPMDLKRGEVKVHVEVCLIQRYLCPAGCTSDLCLRRRSQVLRLRALALCNALFWTMDEAMDDDTRERERET
jgi:hypothetical protein